MFVSLQTAVCRPSITVVRIAALGLMLVPSAAADARAQAGRHDIAFWRALAAKKFEVPAGESADALAREASALLGARDPELRDEIAYSALVAWIYRQRAVSPETTRTLMRDWLGNLTVDLGERGTDSVLRRSFSALSLGIIAALDNEAPLLTAAEFDRLLTGAVVYLHAERDQRGFDPAVGWVHPVAHTADLLKFLGRSRHLSAEQQAVVLSAIGDVMTRADAVFTHGEDERLARAALSIAARDDVDRPGFERWLQALIPARAAGPPTPSQLASDQNRRNLIVSIQAVLATDPRDLASLRDARAIALAALKALHGIK